MPSYDEFREMFAKSSSDEKLGIIRAESKRLLTIAQGFSQIMQKIVHERKPAELPDDFEAWCKKVAESTQEVQDLIDALTDTQHRSIYQAEKKRRDRELGEMIWKKDQEGLPELRGFVSLEDAVDKTADRLGLSSFVAEIRNKDLSFLPASVYFHVSERRARIAAQVAQLESHHYLGYVVTLEWLSDRRNIKWEEHQGLTPSLEEAVKVLHEWLVKKTELQILRQEFQWMSNGIINRKA